MTPLIHPAAVIDPAARIAADVSVGPGAIIEAGVTIGAGCRIGPLVHIQGITEIGADNRIETGAVIGLPPQHLGYKGEPTRLVIGARNWIREYVSIHRPYAEAGLTQVGDDCLLMGFCHIAHDCVVGNRVIIANGAVIGGHATIGDGAFLSGNVAVHQFCRIGRLAMVSGLAGVNLDVPPFCLAEGHKARIRGLNTVGLRRAGLSAAARADIKRLLKGIYRPDTSPMAAARALKADSTEGAELLAFYLESKRGVAGYAMAKFLSATAEAVEADEAGGD